MSNITDPRAKFWGKFAKFAALGVGCFFIAPFVWIAIGGLLGLVCFGGIVGTLWFTKDWIAGVAANARLKLIKHEAASNPVETLQAESLRQSKVLEERKVALETLSGAIRSLDQAIDELQSEFPDSPELPQMRSDQAELDALLKSRTESWTAAYVQLGEFDREVVRVGKLWDVSLKAAKARGASGLTEGEWVAKLQTSTAISSIRNNLNTQLSALSVERMQVEADRILKGKSVKTALPA